MARGKETYAASDTLAKELFDFMQEDWENVAAGICLLLYAAS
jgi:hypothetical protein